jgi:hypothetical protein
MALRVAVGKPRGGKSYGLTKECLEELVFGERILATTLALDLGEINAYIQKEYPDKDIDLFKRVRLLTREEGKRFWLHPAPGVDIPDVTREQEQAGIFPPFEDYYPDCGVMFVIDEAHIDFDARNWALIGQSLTFFNSQHGKLNVEIFFITQFVDLLDKRIRGFAQEFWYYRNLGMENVLTMFRMPRYFTCKVYNKPPSGMLDRPNETHRYRFDARIGRCYDTSAGVGIKGRKKPEKNRKKGFFIGWALVPIAAGLFFIVKAPDVVAGGLTDMLSGTAANVKPAGTAAPKPTASPKPGYGKESPSAESEPLYVRAALVQGQRYTLYLSDGRRLTEREQQVAAVDRARNQVVLVDGQRLDIRGMVSVPEATR